MVSLPLIVIVRQTFWELEADSEDSCTRRRCDSDSLLVVRANSRCSDNESHESSAEHVSVPLLKLADCIAGPPGVHLAGPPGVHLKVASPIYVGKWSEEEDEDDGHKSVVSTSAGTGIATPSTVSEVGDALEWVHVNLVDSVPLGVQLSRSSSRTTVKLENLPSDLDQQGLLSLLDATGFEGLYDFLHISFCSSEKLGFALVNLCSSEIADKFLMVLDGLNGMQTVWSDTEQGYACLIECHRNSAAMHHTVDDSCKPMLFSNGSRILFPKPTQRVRNPLRNCKSC